MVDDDISINSHVGLVTTLDHVPELSLVSAPCDKFVGHGLVALPPRPVGAGDYSVLIGRRNLNAAISHGPQEAFALRGDVRPFPLEQVRDGMAPRGTGRVAPRPALH